MSLLGKGKWDYPCPDTGFCAGPVRILCLLSGLKCNIGLEAGGGLVMLELTSSPVLLLLQQVKTPGIDPPVVQRLPLRPAALILPHNPSQIAKENGEVEHDTSEDKAWRHPINAIDSDDEEYDPDPHTCLDPKRYLSPLKCLRGFPCLTQWRIMNLAIRRTFASGTGPGICVYRSPHPCCHGSPLCPCAVLIHEGRPSPVVFMTLSGDCVVRKNVLTDEDKAKPASSVLADESLQVAIVSPSQFLGLTPVRPSFPLLFLCLSWGSHRRCGCRRCTVNQASSVSSLQQLSQPSRSSETLDLLLLVRVGRHHISLICAISALSLSRCVPIGGVFALLREDQLVNNWRREQ